MHVRISTSVSHSTASAPTAEVEVNVIIVIFFFLLVLRLTRLLISTLVSWRMRGLITCYGGGCVGYGCWRCRAWAGLRSIVVVVALINVSKYSEDMEFDDGLQISEEVILKILVGHVD